MISFRYFLNKIQDVKITDLIAIFPMLVALTVSSLYKNKYKDTWLICEEPKEARDNGYWFFRKMCENHPEQHCIYAIDKSSVDYEKVKYLGEVIQYGSLRHWIIYFSCQHNISSQKGGKPNAALCSFIELNGFYNAHNIFLQHGVIKDDLVWLHNNFYKLDMFVTSAVPEKKFIDEKFGYKDGVVKLTGLPRFDNLHNIVVEKNRIIIMPTWRQWFKLKSRKAKEISDNFINSEYLKKWSELLNNFDFNMLIEKYQLEVIFYLHRNMQVYSSEFKRNIIGNTKIASWEDYDIQELLMTSEMLITDYSSVFFDMVYMKKPIIFYQFDIEDFRKFHYAEGYFHYDNNSFSNAVYSVRDVNEKLKDIIDQGFLVNNEYLQEHKRYFPLFDMNNSERIFHEIYRSI